MEANKVVEAVLRLIESGAVTLRYDDSEIAGILEDLKKVRVRSMLSTEHSIVVRLNPSEQTVTLMRPGQAPAAPKGDAPAEEPKAAEPKAYKHHTFVVPGFHTDMKAAILDAAALVVCGVGPTGSGKTSHLRLMAEELGMELVLVNARKDMETAGFTGEKTVDVDAATKASVIRFLHGPVVKAMRCGLDAEGNEIGKPGLLVIDEFPVIPSWIAISLNNLLESGSSRRKLVLNENGGEVVTSHSGFRIVLLGNTIGRGTTMESADYTAQGDALDISTLDRIDAIFQYGYSRSAEASLLREKIGDKSTVNKILKFRDAIRTQRKNGAVRTPFSTRLLVAVANLHRVFGGDLGKALYYGVVAKVLPEERPIYAEQAFASLGIDLNKMAEAGMDMDY